MKTSNVLRRVFGVAAALVGVLFFFFIIVGVFGLPLAIAGLVVFVLGAVVVCRAFPTEGAEL
jgi:drug/metabolite transporter (DMT)-like permease